MRRPDRHNEIELNLMKNGSLTYLFGGERVTVPHGSLAVFWAAVPHQIVGATGDREYYVVTTPLAWFLQCRLPSALVERLLRGQFLHEACGQRFALDLHLFASWATASHASSLKSEAATRLELHARLLRLAESLPQLENPKTPARSHALLGTSGLSKAERMAAFVAQHYREPLRPLQNKRAT